MRKFLVFIVFLMILLSSCQKKKVIEVPDVDVTVNGPDYAQLHQERYGKSSVIVDDMYLWDNRIIIETKGYYYFLSEDSKELIKLKIQDSGMILDVFSYQNKPCVLGVNKKGYELKCRKDSKWINKKLPDELENSFDVSPAIALSDLDSLLILNSDNIYYFKNHKWSKLKVPAIKNNFCGQYYNVKSIYDRRFTTVELLNDKIFVGCDHGEFGGGLIELDFLKNSPKWKNTTVTSNVNGIIKDSSRNVWVGVGLGHMAGQSAGLYKNNGEKWKEVFYQTNYGSEDEEKFLGGDSSLTSISVSEKDEIFLLARFLGIFKYKNKTLTQIIDWKEKDFLPYRVISNKNEIYLATRGGAIVKFNGKDFVSSFYLNIKEDKFEEEIEDAVKLGNLKELKALIKNGPVDYEKEMEIVEIALSLKKYNVSKYLIEKSEIIHRFLGAINVSQLDMDSLKILLKKGYRIRLSDMGSKFYDDKVKKFLFDNVEIIDEDPERVNYIVRNYGDLELIKLYLKKGYRINHKDRYGETLLHVAIQNGDLIKADFFLKKGADINARMDDGFNTGATPLIMAVRSGNVEAVKFLIKKGVYVTLPDATGNTPFFYARNHGKSMRLFKWAHSSGRRSGGATDYKKIEKLLEKAEKKVGEKERKAVSKMIDKYRLEPKHAELLDAISRKSIDDVKKVLDSGFDIKVYDKREQSVLMSALTPELFKIEDRRVVIKNGNKCSYNFEIFKEVVDHSVKTTGKIFDEREILDHISRCEDLDGIKYLKKKGADFNAKNEYGWTVLNGILSGYSVKNKKCEIAAFLVNSGVNLNVLDGRRSTPLDYAKSECKDINLFDLIRFRGGKTSDEIRAEKKKSKNKI